MASPPKTAASSASKAGSGIDSGLVRELAGILKDTDLTEIEVEKGDLKIRVARGGGPVQHVSYASAPAAAAPAPAAPPASTGHAPAAATAAEPSGERVKSPMVGTVYLQPQPGADPFIAKGASVKAGQTLLLIEAMKTMNPIAAPRDGVIADILVGDGQPVEFGEPLVVLE